VTEADARLRSCTSRASSGYFANASMLSVPLPRAEPLIDAEEDPFLQAVLAEILLDVETDPDDLVRLRLIAAR
jgi:hypothetical protein